MKFMLSSIVNLEAFPTILREAFLPCSTKPPTSSLPIALFCPHLCPYAQVQVSGKWNHFDQKKNLYTNAIYLLSLELQF